MGKQRSADIGAEFDAHIGTWDKLSHYQFVLLFYAWSKCVVSVLDTIKPSQCNYIDTWKQSRIVIKQQCNCFLFTTHENNQQLTYFVLTQASYQTWGQLFIVCHMYRPHDDHTRTGYCQRRAYYINIKTEISDFSAHSRFTYPLDYRATKQCRSSFVSRVNN